MTILINGPEIMESGGNMKKIMFRVFLLLLVLVTGYLLFNQIDARAVPARFNEPPPPVPEAFEKTNGYYRLWTLIEPEGVDVESEDVRLPYRRLFDPAFDNDRFIREFDAQGYKQKYRNSGTPPALSALKPGVDWRPLLRENRELLLRAEKEFAFMLARYERLIGSERFIDFTLIRADSPIPNLLAWLHIAKLSIALDVLAAHNGNAQDGAAHLLRHLHFATRVIANSRTLITNLVAKAVARMCIWGLSEIMNRKDCPIAVFQAVLDGTPELTYEEFGSRFPIICETYWVPLPDFAAMSWIAKLGHRLLYQRNRTQNVRVAYMEKIIAWEQAAPQRWNEDPYEPPKQVRGAFWWLQNPLGKKALDGMQMGNFIPVIYKSYALKATHDMLHIAADLKRRYDPQRPVPDQLDGLPSYRRRLDPCSGRPYLWEDGRQVLYSVGIDRRDNHGDTRDYLDWRDSDYAMPVILFVR
jgi:hypothetical protein